MFRLPCLLRAAAVVAMLFLVDSAAPEAAAQKKSASRPVRPVVPHVHRPGRLHHYMVQARNPHWRPYTVAPNHQAAHVIKLQLQRRGFQVKLRNESLGRVLVLARMMHWHAFGVYASPQIANRVAAVLRARGMQARVHRLN
jgi:hypothetical protein